ncbi:hypothetical protein FRC01_008490, partial [Tulasnella sp. 417]
EPLQTLDILQDAFLNRAVFRSLQHPLMVLMANLAKQVTQLPTTPKLSQSNLTALNAIPDALLSRTRLSSDAVDSLWPARKLDSSGQSSNESISFGLLKKTQRMF